MITLTKEEAQQVLDAMECKQPFLKNALSSYGISTGEIEKMAIETLRAALAQGEQEPFGYFKAEPFGWTDCAETDEGAIPLYERPFTPPQRPWQGLTDEEVRNEAKNHVFDESFFSGAIWARWKIKEKNNG